eukprot:2117464-Amphidinium_carterae.1
MSMTVWMAFSRLSLHPIGVKSLSLPHLTFDAKYQHKRLRHVYDLCVYLLYLTVLTPHTRTKPIPPTTTLMNRPSCCEAPYHNPAQLEQSTRRTVNGEGSS